MRLGHSGLDADGGFQFTSGVFPTLLLPGFQARANVLDELGGWTGGLSEGEHDGREQQQDAEKKGSTLLSHQLPAEGLRC